MASRGDFAKEQAQDIAAVPLALVAEVQGGSRHKARELILQALYQSDISGDPVHRAVGQLCEDNSEGRADLEYFRRIAAGTWHRLEELDQWITKVAVNWSAKRMSAIDRNILRQGVYELLAEPDLPVSVIINEAIVLSKRYGGDGSGAFINGIMDRLAAEIRPAACKEIP